MFRKVTTASAEIGVITCATAFMNLQAFGGAYTRLLCPRRRADYLPCGSLCPGLGWHRRVMVAAVVGAAFGSWTVPALAGPVLAAAGDIACPSSSAVTPLSCQQGATARLVASEAPAAVATLGDTQYGQEGFEDFMGPGAFNQTWGAFKALIHPVPGNHEYEGDSTASGYFTYFGSSAGAGRDGYYSYGLGAWHLVALNSACTDTGCSGESEGHVMSSELAWLRTDLAEHRQRCLLAYWHQPLSSSFDGRDAGVMPLWELLYEAGADVVLNGHVHSYERFAQQDPVGAATSSGIREFVVGTGGDGHDYFPGSFLPTSQAHDDQDFGVLFLTLGPTGYSWKFRTVSGAIADRGSAACHHPIHQTTRPTRKHRQRHKRRRAGRRRR
jgi:calcineurin-like phosphoesterase family protein